MARIKAVEEALAQGAAKRVLERVRKDWGRPWAITSTMARNPAIVEGFLAFHGAIGRSGLSKEDREVICMEMAVQNGCHYCVPAHRYVTDQEGIDKALIQAITRGETLKGDTRPAQLQRLVRCLVAEKGKLSDEDYAGFQAAGFDEAQMIAVVAEIAHCTLTNTFNRLADTDLDPELEAYRSAFPVDA